MDTNWIFFVIKIYLLPLKVLVLRRNTMNRVCFITHKGKRVLLQDCSGMNPGPEYKKVLKEANKKMASEPPKSVLSLFDATNCSFSNASLADTRDFVNSNTPFIKNNAVVGIDGLLQMALTSIAKDTGREFHIFQTREEALEYLVGVE